MSLPDKASRTLVESTYVLEAEPSKLYIKRCEPGILFINLHIRVTLQTGDYDLSNYRFSPQLNFIYIIQKVQCYIDLIKH